MAGDRISEAYNGDMGERMKNVTHLRLSYMLSKLKGDRILDVGCSQGIFAILAAREGRTVVGIDNDVEAIEYANNALLKEPETVRFNTQFLCADFLTNDFGEEHFDTIVFGEIIEHLETPEEFLKKADLLLKEEGIIVASVPFGINRHPDHKKTYYFFGLYNLLSEYFQVREVCYMGKWIAMISGRIADKASSSIYTYDLGKKAFVQLEENILYLEEEWEQRHGNLIKKVKEIEEKDAEKTKEINELKQKAFQTDAEISQLEQKMSKKDDEISEQHIIIENKEKELFDKNDEIESLKKENNGLKGELEQAKLKYKADHTKLKNAYAEITRLESKISIIRNNFLGRALIKIYHLFKNNKNQGNKEQRSLINSTGIKEIRSLKELRVAAILDELSVNSFRYECELKELTSQKWKKEMDSFKPHILFIESAWQGKDNSWRGRIIHCSSELRELVKYSRQNNIPVVFWNKEDPVHIDMFLEAAGLADFCLTTAEECLELYKAAVGHDKVYHMHFAAQPKIHNPEEKYNRKNRFCFAGAYYPEHRERCQLFEAFAAILDDLLGLDIYDRNANRNIDNHHFPDRYKKNIVGTLPAEKIDKAYKGYIYGVNMNTITDSDTMFARRVFELMASNTLVVGNYSKGLNRYFEDLTVSEDNAAELKKRLEELIQNEIRRDRLRLRALRAVLKEHLYEDRVDTIFQLVTGKSLKRELPLIICCVEDEGENAGKQSYTNIVCAKRDEISSIRELIFGDNIYFAFFDPRDAYGSNYLMDMVLTLRYKEADIIGKAEYYSGKMLQLNDSGSAYRKVDGIPMRRAMVAARLLRDEDISELSGDSVISCGSVFSVDRFNYCADISLNTSGIDKIFDEKDNIGIDKMRVSGKLKKTIKEALFKIRLAKRDSLCRKDFYDTVKPKLDAIPVSNGCRYFKKYNIKIAIIADTFFYDSVYSAADFIYITPENALEYIDQVAFLLVVSAWRGLNNEWRFMATIGTETNKSLHKVIDAYKDAGKEIVFYSKEDPPNYEHFLPIARRADVIFTSCAEKVEDYKRDCNTDRIHVMEFCINPVLHNPIGIKKNSDERGVLFAGSWMNKYPKRNEALEMMFDAVIESGRDLLIIDRNYTLNNETYFFPQKYYQYVARNIEHDELQKLHKVYSRAININSIDNSKTMFANRVYELQANGCLMISNYSPGIKEKFKEVRIVSSKEEVFKALDDFDSPETYLHRAAEVRRVMSGETCFDRIAYMLDILGYDFQVDNRSILVIADEVTPEIQNKFDSQTYHNKTLVESANLNEALYNSYDMVCRFSGEYNYGKFYLEDMINAFKYTNCDYVTCDSFCKSNAGVEIESNCYTTTIKDLYSTVFWREGVLLEDFLMIQSEDDINGGYSTGMCME